VQAPLKARDTAVSDVVVTDVAPFSMGVAVASHVVVAVRFTYDLNGLLEVEATVVQTGAVVSALLEQAPGRLTAEQIRVAREELERLKIHPREALPNATALSSAEARVRNQKRRPAFAGPRFVVQ
jgi:molecular chaperone DnaK (HSP70)